MIAIAVLTSSLLVGCASAPVQTAKPQADVKATGDATRVAVIMNQSNSDSVRIASYYLEKRKISRANLISIDTTSGEEISPDKYKSEIEAPIRKALTKLKGIDFIVLTRGIPIRIGDGGGYSVDGALAGMNLKTRQIKQKVGQFMPDELDLEMAVKEAANPYFNSTQRFSSEKFGGMFLVTRLTGYSVKDAYKLIDNSVKAAANKGPFLIDSQPLYQPGSGYYPMEQLMNKASNKLSAQGLDVYYEQTESFSDGREPLMGYLSWGSNDAKFDPNAYHALKFKPGAIAETYVSTSGRTFNETKGGQSLIADLIAQGVTGVKGYVSEPFTFALCHGDVLFGRYANGFNLAEAFYAASPVVKWKDIVIGDPLCRPYTSK